mgnify:CR=1 FL=1|jgi:hypothetical protein
MAETFGLTYHSLPDMDGHYCSWTTAKDFPPTTLEAAQAEVKARNTGRCTQDRCQDRRHTHTGYFSVSRRR